MGIAQRYRLKDPRDFARLRREGRTYRHRLMLISVLANDLPHNRYGFVTSKRVGNAVQRNRARRLLREGVRLTHDRLAVGFDVVVVAHPTMAGQPFATVQAALYRLLEQANLKQPDDRV